MHFPHDLAQTLSATASAPATRAAASDLVTVLVIFTFLAWAILAAVAILKLRVFQPSSLRNVPKRSASLLLPTLLGAFLLYWAVLLLAVGIAQSSGALPAIHTSATAPSTSSASATASQSQPASQAAPSPSSFSDLSPEQNMWLETCDSAAKVLAGAIMLLLIPYLFQNSFRGIGLSTRQISNGILFGALAFIIIYPLLQFSEQILSLLYSALNHQPKEQDVVEILQQARHSVKIVDSLLAAFVAPMVEELFFRGFLQTALIQKPGGLLAAYIARRYGLNPVAEYTPSPLRRWSAILITALIFAAVHSAPDQFPILFLLAVGLGYTYERTGNLFASMTVHSLFNLMTVVPLLIGKS